MRNIPRPEEHSAELAAVIERQGRLVERQTAIHQEQAAIHAKAELLPTQTKDRVAALVAGISYQPPADDREALASLAREDRDIKEALDELAQKRSELLRHVSREISQKFRPEYEAQASDFYDALCLAAEAHWKFGALKTSLTRAGVEPLGLADFGRDFFGSPTDRNNDVALELRKAARAGFIKESQIPAGYR